MPDDQLPVELPKIIELHKQVADEIANAGTNPQRSEALKIKEEMLRHEIQRRMDEARVSAEKEKDLLIEEARKSAALIVESSKKEIEAQKADAVCGLTDKVAELSVMAAERILMKQLDHRANTDLSSKYLAELEKERPDLRL